MTSKYKVSNFVKTSADFRKRRNKSIYHLQIDSTRKLCYYDLMSRPERGSERRFPQEYINALNSLGRRMIVFTRDYVGDDGRKLEGVLVSLTRVGTDPFKFSREASKNQDLFLHGLMEATMNVEQSHGEWGITGEMVSASLDELIDRVQHAELFEDSPS